MPSIIDYILPPKFDDYPSEETELDFTDKCKSWGIDLAASHTRVIYSRLKNQQLSITQKTLSERIKCRVSQLMANRLLK